ncbi:M4 family metallopeptidase [Macrococcoides canis]|uniref:M4 family metallopeptidase n=1 Tax=Macrococcoides canis TaxID=1855823 RepID=UPI0039C9405C
MLIILHLHLLLYPNRSQYLHMSKYLSTTADYGGIHTNMAILNKSSYNTITVLDNVDCKIKLDN